MSVCGRCRFAAPRVGGHVFNLHLNVCRVPVLNVVNVRDFVHRLPAAGHPVIGKIEEGEVGKGARWSDQE